jgi:hypothetical protein
MNNLKKEINKNNLIYNCMKENKILGNKLIQRGKRLVTENDGISLKEKNKTQIKGKTSRAQD